MVQYVLEILDGDRAGEVVSLTDQPLRIGRKPGNDLVLADEKTSGVHAEVVLEGGRHVLRDLGSTNGTHMDGRRVTEIVLSPGDVVAIGRLRVCYRDQAAAGSGAAGVGSAHGESQPGGDGGFGEVRRLDTARVSGRSGGLLGLAGLALVGLAAGGYLWWSGSAEESREARGQRQVEPQVVPGNKLAKELASCEAVEGWRLQAAGTGFDLGGTGHTGRSCLEAVRGEGVALDYGIATLTEPLAVLSNRSIQLSARFRTDGGGEGAIRAVFFAQNEQMPFRYRSGSPLASYAGWTEVAVALAVPPGCDRMQLELVAVLPQAGATVSCDDLVVLEQGDTKPVELRIEQSKQTVLGTGAALAVRSTDADNQVVLHEVLPARVRPALASLQKDGWLALSDIGAKLACTASERSLQLVVEGAADRPGDKPEALLLMVPAEAASGMRLQNGSAPFQPLAPVSMAAATGASATGASGTGASGSGASGSGGAASVEATAVLFGDRATRAMVVLPNAAPVQAQVASGILRLEVGANAMELVLGFAAERERAGAALRRANQEVAAGRWGEALDALQAVLGDAPHDSEILAQAQVLRDQVLAGQADEIRRLQTALADASFYKTRGGFERVLAGISALQQAYGQRNPAANEACAALAEQAERQLKELLQESLEQHERRLERLAKALQTTQPGLAELVSAYLERQRATPSTGK